MELAVGARTGHGIERDAAPGRDAPPVADAVPLPTVAVHLTSPLGVRLWGLAFVGLFIANLGSLAAQFVWGRPYLLGLVPMFHLDHEQNMPSYVSALALLWSAGLLASIALATRRETSGEHRYWGVLAGVFVFLSFDEAISIHELLTKPVRRALDAPDFLYTAWVVPYAVIVALLAVAGFRFWWNLPAVTRRGTALAGLAYLSGVVGVEVLGEWYAATHRGDDGVRYALLTTCEESLELLGIWLFVRVLTQHVETFLGPLSLRLDPGVAGRPVR